MTEVDDAFCVDLGAVRETPLIELPMVPVTGGSASQELGRLPDDEAAAHAVQSRCRSG
ncbi:MAG: hypothetical protein ICV73_13405 [Acetobacteraceae bacterium]|nr:hypothetical protein [Acetobacteraceae bacterium]